jgi:transcriptional regulator with XRE-family HTH domain
MTQGELASALGVARTSVTNIEAGRQGLSASMLWRIAGILGCNPNALLPEAQYRTSESEVVLPTDLTPKSRELLTRLGAE